MSKSDVARLLAQIDTEYAAAELGLHGLAQGTAQHEFINARYDRIGELQGQLGVLVGADEAARLVVERLDKSGGKA
jgi:hypothetical protein